ncbi:serine/threonine protein kinase [candidate division KSB1 bacterium]|nr:serine/threonine protein kinase [candidate division KSB1 bacterium]
MTSKKIKKKLGKYQIERQIGKGSAANIYLAEQDSLGRKLVIKELLPLYSSNEKIVIRFQREAKLISQLSHEAITHIYDYWVKGNSYYIAMEYVPGPHIRKILSTVHHVPVHIAALIIYQICRGLDHAHKAGVIHRDLKPANIMISNLGQVKILDFGVAHFQAEENLTALGAVLGTYHYMSPEQAVGKKVTPASDVFSLGILVYELLTGIKPFSKDDDGEVLEKIVNKKVRSVRRINPAVPRSLDRIIKKCLKKNSKRRFQDADQIKLKLEKVLKKYSLDHNAILKTYLDNLAPTPPDPHWPPNLWRRILYRLTHQSIRTYFIWVMVLAGFGFGEYYLHSRGITLQHQWNVVQKVTLSAWDRVIPAKSDTQRDQEINSDAKLENPKISSQDSTSAVK